MDQPTQDQATTFGSSPAAGTPPAGSEDAGASPAGQAAEVGTLLSGAVEDLGDVVRGEVKLAQTELKEQAVAASGGVAAIGAGGVAGLFGADFLLLATERLLARWMPSWASAGLVGLSLLGGAAALGATGKAKLTQANPLGTQTAASLRETVDWAKGRLQTLKP